MKATATEISKRITISENKTEGILNYDFDNAYPQRIVDIVNASGAGTSCINMKTRFLVGGGMKDLTFYKSKVNKEGMTIDQLLRKIAVNMSYLPFVALHVNYNALFEPVEVNYVPFAYVRLTNKTDKDHASMVAIYDDWQKIGTKKIDKKKIEFLNFYNRNPEVIQAEVDAVGGWEFYKGQVFLYSPEGFEYPLATYDSVLEDIQTDSKAKIFKFRNITTNFMASHMVVTNKFENEGDREEFHTNLETFQGSEDAMKLFHIEKETDEDTIELKKIEIQDVEKLYEFTESSVRENIILSFTIPPVLLLRNAGSAFSSNQISEATAFYNGITADERLVIEEIFKEIFTGFAENINTSNDYSIIPFKAPVSESELGAEYLKYFTTDEIRESKGYAKAEQVQIESKPLFEVLGVGGLQAINSMLADPVLTREQKLAQCTNIYNLSMEKAVELVDGIKTT